MSLSLIAVFIPILLMGGIVGRLFREFAVTLSVAIADLAGRLADHDADDVRAACCAATSRRSTGGSTAPASACSTAMLDGYDRTLALGAAPPARSMLVVAAGDGRRSTSTCSSIVPKGFFPQQDTGRLIGGIQADQSISFQAMRRKLAPVRARSSSDDPAVDSVVGFTGGGQTNSGFVFVALKPLGRAQGSRPTR